MVKKVQKNTVVSEKIEVKDFSLGQFPPQRGKLSYMGARVLRARDSIMSIFEKKVFQVLRFCALLMTSLISGELGEPKVGSFVLFFSLNIM